MTATMEKSTVGTLTDDDIARAKRQIGVPKFAHTKPYNLEPSADGFRHFAFACGDDNPLWHDPAYGAKSRWRGQIAPPMFLQTTGQNLTPKPDAETKALFKGLFKGVGKYYMGDRWTWWRPLYVGDRTFVESSTADIQVQDASNFSGGRTVKEIYRFLYCDGAGQVLGERRETFLNAEREGTKKAGKYANTQRHVYTPEDIARLDEVYAAEQRQGASPRYWDDVEIGQPLTPVAKGPLTMVEIIAMHMGMGLSHSGIGPLRYNWSQRQRMPGFFVDNAYGVPDVVQRVHWDEVRAKELGLPTSYDYGWMRTSWLMHLVTNWMGDDAWLWTLESQTRAFNFMGDFTICSGEVVDKRVEGIHHVVELKLQGVNQRGEVTAPGSATVILPTKAEPVVLPEPPQELKQRAAAMLQDAARREGARAD